MDVICYCIQHSSWFLEELNVLLECIINRICLKMMNFRICTEQRPRTIYVKCKMSNYAK